MFSAIYEKLRVFNLFIGFVIYFAYKKTGNKFFDVLLSIWKNSTTLLQKY